MRRVEFSKPKRLISLVMRSSLLVRVMVSFCNELAKEMVSASLLALASVIAARKEPEPESLEFVTIKFDALASRGEKKARNSRKRIRGNIPCTT